MVSLGFMMGVLPLLYYGLVLLSWIVLYRRGAEARDLLFWGAVAVVVPIPGPMAAIVYGVRLQRDKMKRVGRVSA